MIKWAEDVEMQIILEIEENGEAPYGIREVVAELILWVYGKFT